MAGSRVGVLLALSGDDADILRCLNQPGSGMSVVRRCADLPELLSAGLAGLASIAVIDTGFEEIDRTVLERLGRAGLSGLLLVEADEEDRWRSCGWPVERRDAEAGRIRAALQGLVRNGLQDASAAPAPGAPDAPDGAADRGPGGGGHQAPGPSPAPRAMSPAEQTAWLEEMWHLPSHGAGPRSHTAPGPGGESGGGPAPGRDRADPEEAMGAAGAGGRPGGGRAGRQGRLVVVWGPHGAPGRSTVAASLAHGLGRAGGAILVDADVEAPCLVQLLGLPDDSSALAGAARLATHGRLDAEAFARLLSPASRQVRLLGGLGRSGRWRELPPASMKEVWLQCRSAAAWTVVDVAGGPIDDGVDDFTLEPGRAAVAFDLVRRADVVVMVGAGDPVGVRRLLQLLADLEAEAPPSGPVQVVVNRVRASVAGPAPRQAVLEALGRFGGLTDVVLLPEDGATADRCLLRGRSILDEAPSSPLGRALEGLVARIDPSAAPTGARRGRRRWLVGAGRTDDSGERGRGRARGNRSASSASSAPSARGARRGERAPGAAASRGLPEGPGAGAARDAGPPGAAAGPVGGGPPPGCGAIALPGTDPRAEAGPAAAPPVQASCLPPPPPVALCAPEPSALGPGAPGPGAPGPDAPSGALVGSQGGDPGAGAAGPVDPGVTGPAGPGGTRPAAGGAGEPGAQRRRPSPWLRPAFGAEEDRPSRP